MMKNLVVTVLCLFCLVQISNAQTSEKKWAVGAGLGLNMYNGDLGNGIFNPDQYPYIFEELSFSRYLSPSFDLGLFGSYGHYGFWITGKTKENFRAFKTQGSLLLKYKFANGYLLNEGSKLSPFFSLGAGAAGFQNRTETGGIDIVVPVGGGISYQITKSLAVQYTALYNFTNSDNRDFNEGGRNDHFLAQTLGIIFSFGPKAKDNKDSDNDGVPDRSDKCPNVAGIASNKGCPEIEEETKKIFEQALTGIQFETGKDVIQEISFPILDQVAKVMNDNANYNLEINGHTDNQGDPAMNLALSQNRAESVKKYLTEKGIAANRMSTNGYGETKPIADNSTAEGRAQNRRVEFKVNF